MCRRERGLGRGGTKERKEAGGNHSPLSFVVAIASDCQVRPHVAGLAAAFFAAFLAGAFFAGAFFAAAFFATFLTAFFAAAFFFATASPPSKSHCVTIAAVGTPGSAYRHL